MCFFFVFDIDIGKCSLFYMLANIFFYLFWCFSEIYLVFYFANYSFCYLVIRGFPDFTISVGFSAAHFLLLAQRTAEAHRSSRPMPGQQPGTAGHSPFPFFCFFFTSLPLTLGLARSSPSSDRTPPHARQTRLCPIKSSSVWTIPFPYRTPTSL